VRIILNKKGEEKDDQHPKCSGTKFWSVTKSKLSDIHLPSLSVNSSTGGKMISSPPANSFITSSNFVPSTIQSFVRRSSALPPPFQISLPSISSVLLFLLFL
jgi:hypothetical protein